MNRTATAAGKSGFAIIRLDPALDAMVSADAVLETAGDRLGHPRQLDL